MKDSQAIVGIGLLASLLFKNQNTAGTRMIRNNKPNRPGNRPNNNRPNRPNRPNNNHSNFFNTTHPNDNQPSFLNMSRPNTNRPNRPSKPNSSNTYVPNVSNTPRPNRPYAGPPNRPHHSWSNPHSVQSSVISKSSATNKLDSKGKFPLKFNMDDIKKNITTTQDSTNGCGKARLADFDWSSANIHTAIVGFILEHGYGCEVSITKGSTTPIMAAHYDGQLDVVTELWYDNIRDTYDSHEAANTVRNLGVNTPDAQQAFYVDRATADKYNLRTVLDMLDPEIAALFSDPENPSMGRMTSCIGGWTCYTINLVKQKAYGLDKFYTNFDPGSGGALDAAIAGAFAKKQPIFTYYWAPTGLMGKVDLVRLTEPPFNAECWASMQVVVEDIKANGTDAWVPTCGVEYRDMSLDKSVLSSWADTHPEETAFLEAYTIPTAQVNRLLAFYEDESDGDMELTAMEYLANNSEWKSWVPANVAAKVSGAL